MRQRNQERAVVVEVPKCFSDGRAQFCVEKDPSTNTIEQFVSVIRSYEGTYFTNFADDVAIDAPYQRLCYLKNGGEVISGIMFTCLDGCPHITAMATKREYQSRGYGKQLMNHFVNYVSQLGFHSIELYAWSEKTKPICASTQAFYKSVGFVVQREHMGLWAQDMITVKMKKSWGEKV
jgi:ribosomal protein S18 acetylase RimI-like enzyme